MSTSRNLAASLLAPLWALGAALASAQECPLTLDSQVAAVKAFRAMSPVFKEARCLNCHGAVNPFSENGAHGGGYIDIRREVAEFLREADVHKRLTTGLDPDGTIAAREIASLRDIASSPRPIEDNDFIRRNALDPMRESCKQCHVDSWVIPMRDHYFTARDATQMCMHLKQSSLTNPPDRFLRHMQEDDLVLEGFKGQRGLLTAPGAQPPRITHAAVTKHANDWIAAMDGKFHDPPECGCKLDRVILSVRYSTQDSVDSAAGRLGDAMFGGEVNFNVTLAPGADENWLSGAKSVVRKFAVTHVTPRCNGTAQQTELWYVRARIDEERKVIVLHMGYTTDDESGSWSCTYPGYKIADDLQVRVHSTLMDEAIEVPLGDEVTRTLEVTQPGSMLTRESLTLTILR